MNSQASNSGQGFSKGNAIPDAKQGWFIGQFLPESGGRRRRQDFEMKWGIHPKGERKTGEWAFNKVSTTLSILLKGEFIIWFRIKGEVHEARLQERGDYVIWDAGVAHTWEAQSNCVVLTIRCPSVEGDHMNADAGD